jgi:hypothetical protein
MSIQYDLEHDIESVFGLLTDPDFLVDRSLQLGELEAACEVSDDGEIAVVEMTRKLKRDLPGFLAKMMDPVQTVRITERWQADGEGGWTGEYDFEMEGQPVWVGADFELYPTDAGCCYAIEHRTRAKIPLIGRKIEKFVLTQAEQGCMAELDYLRDRLG